jgi:hypothetical protein
MAGYARVARIRHIRADPDADVSRSETMSRIATLLCVTALVATTACDPAGDPVGATVPTDLAPVAFSARDLGALLRSTGATPPIGISGVPTVILRTESIESAAAGDVVYDALPDPLPGSYPSLGFQATQTDEWGDHVILTQGGPLGGVTVGLSSWACENDASRAPDEACVTTPGTTFTHAVTLNLYEVDLSGSVPAVGPLLATRTQTFAIPFRPSWDDAHCWPPAYNAPFGGQWYDPVLARCVDGLATPVHFDFSGMGVVLPEQVIFGVAFNTETAGADPIGTPGPYNSLNLGVANYQTSPPPSVGSDAEPDYTFWDTALANWYCDGGAGGVDIFRRDGCWGGITPIVRITLGEAEEPAHTGSVMGSGLWREPGASRRGGPQARLTVAAGHRGGTAALSGQVDLSVPWADVRLRSSVLTGLVLDVDRAVLEGEGDLDGLAVRFVMTIETAAGPGGASTVEIVVSPADAPGDVVYQTGGAIPLAGGHFQIG